MANYTRGTFVDFRTTTPVHLGKIGVNLEKDETVSFDGQVLKTSSGTDYPDMQSLQSAIKVGWLVPATDTVSVYKPIQPVSSSKISTALVHDEDRNVGNIQGIRDGAAVKRAGGDQTPKKFPTVTLAEGDEGSVVGSAVKTPTAPTSVPKTATKAPFAKTYAVEQAAGDGEAVVVGSALRSAKTSTVISSENAQRVAQSIQNLDNQTGKRTMPVVSDQTPVQGTTSKTASVSQEINTKATVIPTDLGFDPKQAGIDSATGGTTVDGEKLKLVQAVLPGFTWDMTGHWKTRVKVALEHKNDPMFIFGVMAVESPAVKKAVQDALATA